jgi:GT2 family glycosyltransferase
MLRKLIERIKASVVTRLLRDGRANRESLEGSLPLVADASLLVNSLFKTAFGRLADPEALAHNVDQLQSGVVLEVLAEGLVGSAEFQTRHGTDKQVDKEYIAALYRDGLGRPPDPEGLASWLAEGEKGATRAQVLAAFAKSNEALEKSRDSSTANPAPISEPLLLVHSLYKAAFGRFADAEGLGYRIQQLQSGVSLEALAEELASSAEFQTRHGTDKQVDKEYIAALYRDGLGRPPDPEGLASWLAEGEKGATRAQVLAAFARSNEAREKSRDSSTANPTPISESLLLVHSLYKAAFGRFADAEGLGHRIQQLQSGVSLEALAEELAGSAEFETRHGTDQQVDKEYIAALYRDGLGGPPDPDGLASWLGAGEKGARRASALAGIAGSDEAIKKGATLLVNSLYRAAFCRLADPGGLAHRIQQLRSGISLEVLAEEIVGSVEFETRHGSSQRVDIKYVRALYRNGLGCEPDLETLTSWLAEGKTGATRAKVLAAFAGSNEVMDKTAVPAATELSQMGDLTVLVNSLYRVAFGRLADPNGLANWIQQLQSGVSLEALAEELVRTPEFQIRHGLTERIDIKYLTALYRDGLKREPTLENLAFWLAEGKNGATRAKVLAALAKSDEAMERFLSSQSDGRRAYSRWIALHDTITDPDRAAIRAHIAGLPFRPLISVIMSISKTSKSALLESVNSVLTQLYPYWELCVAVDTDTEPLWRVIVRHQQPCDPRIRVVRTETVKDTAAAGNAAFNVATGEFVAFLRSGDILSEHALYEAAVELGASAHTDIVYSDHDQIDAGGQRTDPWFKPGWDPDLLLAQDYVSNLAVYRRKLVEGLGSLRPGFEGAELHDLALRATGATTSDHIRHIAAILYHRRSEDHAIHSENALPALRTIAASHRAVRDHLDSRGDSSAVLKPAQHIPSAMRVVWPLPEHPLLVSVIVPTRDRADLLAQCVDGVLHRTDYPNLELLILDNGSIEPATHRLFDRLTCEDRRVRILHHPGPFNYSALNNAAAREANGEILLLLNNDIDVIDSGWLYELVSQVLRPDVGIVGAKLLYANEHVQHGGVMLGPEGHAAHLYRYAGRNDPGYFGQLALARTLSAVTGACAAIRHAVFFEVGGFDEVNLPVAFNDIDLCLRLGDYGYRVVWTPFAELFHLESVSRGIDIDDSTKRERAYREWLHIRNTWGSLLEDADPFHNPNLLFHPDYYEIPTSRPRRRKPWHFMIDQLSDLNRYFPPANEALIETNHQ